MKKEKLKKNECLKRVVTEDTNISLDIIDSTINKNWNVVKKFITSLL